jgi:hypothetical protein
MANSYDSYDLPANVLQQSLVDPALGTGAPQNFGQDVIPHIHTASGKYGIASHAYLNQDEATQHSKQNAERMRKDCGIMESVEARQRAVALLPWHIEPEDKRDSNQVALAAEMTAILEETPRFTEYRRVCQEAIWYGRYGIANSFGADTVRGRWRTVVSRWEPRHGDKLVFRFDDGDKKQLADQVGIRVSTSFRRSADFDSRRKIQATEVGLVYWLDQWERRTMVVHKHMVEDGPWEDPRSLGRIHGVGIRDRIYWTWYCMVECLQRVVEFLDRAAFGIEVWPYPQGNDTAKKKTEEAATKAMGGGRSVILVPLPPGENMDMFMPQIIEPGLSGVDSTIRIIKEYFGHQIKRYIIGQTLTSEADATGLGSGVADAHLATLADILTYDARNQEETLTQDLLRPLQAWNFRNERAKLKFKIDTESDNAKEKMEAISKAFGMGLKVKSDDIYQIIAMSKPDADDEVLSMQQIQQSQNPVAGVGGGIIRAGQDSQAGPGSIFSPEKFHQDFMAKLAV